MAALFGVVERELSPLLDRGEEEEGIIFLDISS